MTRIVPTVVALACALGAAQTRAQSQSPAQPGDPTSQHNEEAARATASPSDGISADAQVTRVGGDLDAKIVENDGVFRFDTLLIDTPLPKGYPQPTPPGAIEIKRYDSYRRAEFTTNATPGIGQNVAFWPLFKHITGRDIAMTSPVEMDMHAWADALPAERANPTNNASQPAPRGLTMSFLYRTRDLGPTGKDGDVTVRDSDPGIYLSIGTRGTYLNADTRQAIDALRQWLAAQSDWRQVPGSPPRVLGYNGPDRRPNDLWGEVQLVVERAPSTSSDSARPAAPANGEATPDSESR
ncbi:MAG: heme-binding protein [Planctomycetota bacterium]|nr:heme-binding protein [Planctomycetota bacterium]